MSVNEELKEDIWCEALSSGHIMRYRALGASMSPFIKGGSILTVKPGARIYTGDIVCYRGSAGLVTHRVIGRMKINGEIFFVTKGDNVRYRDSLVAPSEILGNVIQVEDGRRTIRLNSFPGKALNYIIAVSSALFLYRMLWLMRKIRSAAIFRRNA